MVIKISDLFMVLVSLNDYSIKSSLPLNLLNLDFLGLVSISLTDVIADKGKKRPGKGQESKNRQQTEIE